MQLSFHIGSRHFNEVNTVKIFGIKGQEYLEVMKWITANSPLKNNGTTEETFQVHPLEGEAYQAHNLTIYFPDYDEKFQNYGDFRFLFKHEEYQVWKKAMITVFPELAKLFKDAEQETLSDYKRYEKQERAQELREYAMRYRLFPQRVAVANIQFLDNDEAVSFYQKMFKPV